MNDKSSSTKTTKSTPKKRRKPYHDWKPRFLRLLAETANVSKSAKACRIDRTTAYGARETDPAFARAWDEATEVACDVLEYELRRRALKGSDTCLIFSLKAHRPGKYRERIENWNFDASKLSDEQLTRLAAGENPAHVLAGSGARGA